LIGPELAAAPTLAAGLALTLAAPLVAAPPEPLAGAAAAGLALLAAADAALPATDAAVLGGADTETVPPQLASSAAATKLKPGTIPARMLMRPWYPRGVKAGN